MKRTVAIGCLALGLVVAVAAAVGSVRATGNSGAAQMPDLVAVRIEGHKQLWVQRYEITVAEWNACHAGGGCTRHLIAPGGRDAHVRPATTLSQPDAAE